MNEQGTPSDTPRTDKKAYGGFWEAHGIDFARQLEREIAAAQADNAQLRRIIERGRDSNATELGLAAQLDQQRNGNLVLLGKLEAAQAEIAGRPVGVAEWEKLTAEVADLRAQLAAEKENVRLQVADRIQLQHIINRRDTEIFDLKNAAEAEKESGKREAVLRQLDWAKETLNEHRRELHMNDEFPGEGTAMLEGVVNSLQRLAALATPPDSGKGEEVTFPEVFAEIQKAVAKFPTWPTDPLHALAVLGEEYGELTKATLQLTYEPHKTSMDELRTEAIQTAAMALRFLQSLPVYEFKQGEQHAQALTGRSDG